MSRMSKKKKAKCHAIIHTATVAAGSTSFFTSQLPFADSLAIVPAQMTMVIGLAKVFGYKFSTGLARSFIAPLVVQELGKGAAKQLVGVIPVAGNIVKSGVSVSFTEALGWLMAEEFKNGSDNDLSLDDVLQNAKKAAKHMKIK